MLKVALVSIWFHRGQTVVTQTFKRALEEEENQVFVHARKGAVYNIPKQERLRFGWDSGNGVVYWDEYDLKKFLPSFLLSLKKQGVDIVLFNEEYDWGLVEAVKQEGIAVGTYLDYLHSSWLETPSPLKIYDVILCSTQRTYRLVEQLPGVKARFVGWGIHPDITVKYFWDKRPYLFFENVGWLGINDRKGFTCLLNSYEALLKRAPDLHGSLLVHSQVGVKLNVPGVDLVLGSMNQPGLYHMAKIYCYPAKLDGLGLSLLEAMANGLAIVCPDAAPWNEFVEDGYNGLLVPITSTKQRDDGIAFPEVEVDSQVFSEAMERLAKEETTARRLATNSFRRVGEVLSWAVFKRRLIDALRTAV